MAAVGVLSSAPDGAGVPGLEIALRDAEREVRLAAVQGLSGIAGGAGAPGLERALADAEREVRLAAWQGLRCGEGPTERVRRLLQAQPLTAYQRVRVLADMAAAGGLSVAQARRACRGLVGDGRAPAELRGAAREVLDALEDRATLLRPSARAAGEETETLLRPAGGGGEGDAGRLLRPSGGAPGAETPASAAAPAPEEAPRRNWLGWRRGR